ncbi:MAG: hypothetical protein QOF13_1307 [Solirubrobacterales bacterium]|jgi:hypothetical protein|nr:hypothetical protein [Solirubrobacterales bacterium]
MDQTSIESLPEERRNALLRRNDWRFLLRREDSLPAAEPPRIGFPSRRALTAAQRTLPAGGELLCTWRVPRLRGTQRARQRLGQAGFTDLRLLWPGPLPQRLPQFWLPPESPAAIDHLLASRPAGSRLHTALRPLWRLVARLGLLAPVFVLARAPGGAAPEGPADDPLTPYLTADSPCLLLTGGHRSINKVVALPFAPGEAKPAAVVKFARLSEADLALEREAAALEAVERSHPGLDGVPRLLARGRRAGGRALVESAIYGKPLIGALSPQSFEGLAGRVTEWLVGLAEGSPATAGDWKERLLDGPLAEFERNFGDVASPGTVGAARTLLDELDGLPQTCEHRDCSPWNVILAESGAPTLLDWESAEPRGLPGLDLAYFLANAAFVIEGALESGRTREIYRHLLDPATSLGAVAARCGDQYCARLGLSPRTYAGLRVLCWIVHSRSDYRHLEIEAAGPPRPERLRDSTYLGLLEEELRQFSGKE